MATTAKSAKAKSAKAKAAKVEPRPVRVLVVDDHPIVREGLARIIRNEPRLSVCGEAETARETLQAAEALKPDMVVLDLMLKDSNGLEVIKDLQVRHPKLPVLVLSMHEEAVYAERALKAGARGYLMKDQARAKIAEAIRRVIDGEVYLSPVMSQAVLTSVATGRPASTRSPVDCLTDRELEVFRMIGQGMGTKDIARRLFRSVRTIDAHRENIKRKMGLLCATDLTQRAIAWARSE